MVDNENQQSAKFSTPLSQYQASIINITNPSDLVSNIEMNLRYHRVDSSGRIVKISQDADPLMNEEGIAACVSIISSIIAQNTVMSETERWEVANIMENLIQTLSMQLMMNRKKWDIKSSEDRTRILAMILNPCYITLKRSFMQGERDFWKGSIGEFVHTNSSSSQTKPSFWSNLNPWRRDK